MKILKLILFISFVIGCFCQSETPKSRSQQRPVKPASLPRTCGVGSAPDKIQASEATVGGYPWIVAIYAKSGNRWSQTCGGSVVSNKHVLTTVHCMNAGSVDNYRVRLGDHNLEVPNELPKGSTVDANVSKIILHPDYSRSNFGNDIALLELASPLTFSKYIQPICLPFDGVYNDLDDEYAVIAGWRKWEEGDKKNVVLKHSPMRIWPLKECQNAFKDLANIISTQLCASDESGKHDSCYGDGGGPLMYREGGKFYVIGLVSFGKKCGTEGYPGVFTRVTSHLEWLEKVL